jgi:hypothetical protein
VSFRRAGKITGTGAPKAHCLPEGHGRNVMNVLQKLVGLTLKKTEQVIDYAQLNFSDGSILNSYQWEWLMMIIMGLKLWI